MKTDQDQDPTAVFPQIVNNAVSKLKNRLQQETSGPTQTWVTSFELSSTRKKPRRGNYLFRICFCPTWWKRISPNSDCGQQRSETITFQPRPASRQTKTIISFRLMRIAKQSITAL